MEREEILTPAERFRNAFLALSEIDREAVMAEISNQYPALAAVMQSVVNPDDTARRLAEAKAKFKAGLDPNAGNYGTVRWISPADYDPDGAARRLAEADVDDDLDRAEAEADSEA